jgi:membrane associated rhomboid family serine protease
MATHDPHYPTRGAFSGSGSGLTPVTKGLLIANIAVFLIDRLILKGILEYHGHFSIGSAVFGGRIWEFLTFQFLHASPLHLAANCLGLYFTGAWMERWWGSLRFLGFFLLSGIAGAAFYTALVLSGVLPDHLNTPLVGASAGIFAILVGVAVVAPHLRVRLLFPPVEMAIRHLAIGILIVVSGTILFKIGDNVGGEAGHFGGMLMGFLLVKFPKLLGVGWERRSHKIVRADFSRSEPKLKPRTRVDLTTQDEVDRILDKISRDGIQSLTQEERDRLKAASQNSSRR